jgi:hypothetical protein
MANHHSFFEKTEVIIIETVLAEDYSLLYSKNNHRIKMKDQQVYITRQSNSVAL